MTVIVELGDELRDWRKSKKSMSTLLATDIAEKHLAYKRPVVTEAISLYQAQIQLRKAYVTNPVTSKAVGFVANPIGVCALQHFAAGALVLKPYGSLHSVKEKDKENMKVFFGSFGVAAPKMLSEIDKVDDKTALVPFWHVKSTREDDLVNMTLEAKKIGSVELPCYVNSKELEPGDLLLCENEALAKKRMKESAATAAAVGETKAKKAKR